MRFTKAQITLFVALLLGNAIILFGPQNWGWLRLPVVTAVVFVLPGWAWLPVFGWLRTRQAIERVVLLFGVSTLLSSLALYFAVVLPGPFTESPTLVTLNLLILTGLIGQIFVRHTEEGGSWQWPSRTVLIILLVIIAVASVTRFTRLGYAEFHEDELENMRLIVRAYKGEEFVPFIDSKGPIHWLLPAALWYGNGWLNEALARIPFALASVMLVPLMYALGRRMSGGKESVALIAASIVALNGFYVSLARHVENRVLIVFWGALAIWFAYRYTKDRLNAFALYAAFTLAMGLIAHPTVITYLPAAAFVMLARGWPSRSWKSEWPWLAGGAALFVGVAAIFYVPYLLNPAIGLTYQYFAEERVGTALLYNRIDSMLGESELYNSRYYGPVLVLLMGWLLGREFNKLGGRGLVLFSALSLGVISTAVFPEILSFGQINLAFVPSALLALALLLLPCTKLEIKTNMLWFAVPFGVLLFLARDASNHIQIAYTGLTMLAAFGLVDLWSTLNRPALIFTAARTGLIIILIIVVLLTLTYQYLSFDSPVLTYWQAKADYTDNPDSVYAILYGSIPRPRKVISNPRLGGWKTVGYLWETGQLSGDFRSINESFAVPIWYTFQTPRSCYTDPQNYWLRRDWTGWPEEEQQLPEHGYTLTRVVLVDGQPKLHLYEKNGLAGAPQILDVDDYRQSFDLLATPARFAQDEDISQLAFINFGDKLLLRGYNLPATAQPGRFLPVTVFWEALAPMNTRYRAFVHLIGPDGAMWGQHDDDPACRLLTNEMQSGMPSSRQFRLPVPPDVPAGTYTVILGVYHPDTLERLDIWDTQSQSSPGNSLILGQVRVE